MLTDSLNFFTATFISKFAINWSLKVPPHLKRTLPCEMSRSDPGRQYIMNEWKKKDNITVKFQTIVKLEPNKTHHFGNVHQFANDTSSSSCSLPLLERCHFHDFTPQFTIIRSVPGSPQPQVLLFEVVLYPTKPCLSTARSSPLLRRIVDASVEGPCVVLI